MKFVCPKWDKCSNYHHELPCWSEKVEQISEVQVCLRFEPKIKNK